MGNEFIVPTGRIIKEYLEEYNISQKELCSRIGMSERHISNLLNGNTRITEEFALKLECVLVKIPASYWINYEAKYREYLARENEEIKLNQENLLQISKRFKFNEVFKGLDWPLTKQAREMLKILKISDFDCFIEAYSNLSVEFMEDGGEIEAIAVWLNLCEAEIEVQNDDISDIAYNSKMVEDSLPKFKMLAYNENVDLSINSCRKLCNKLGINLVVHEAITNSKIRGALTTHKKHPSIYISGRFKSHDNIWFAFIHELGHLIKHYNQKDIIISYEDDENKINPKELEANEFARNFFINPIDYDEFILQKPYTAEKIKSFAKKQNVLPGIIVARLQHDKYLDYDKFTNYKINF